MKQRCLFSDLPQQRTLLLTVEEHSKVVDKPKLFIYKYWHISINFTAQLKRQQKRKEELKNIPADRRYLQIDLTRYLLHYLGYHLIFTEKCQNEPVLTILSFALLVPTSHLGFVAGFSSWTNFDGRVLKWRGGDGHFISTLSETRHRDVA